MKTTDDTLTLSESLGLYALMSSQPGIHRAEDWDVVAAELEREATTAPTWAQRSVADRAKDARLNAMSARARY